MHTVHVYCQEWAVNLSAPCMKWPCPQLDQDGLRAANSNEDCQSQLLQILPTKTPNGGTIQRGVRGREGYL